MVSGDHDDDDTVEIDYGLSLLSVDSQDSMTEIFESLMFLIGRNAIAGQDKVLAVTKLRRIVALDGGISSEMIEQLAVQAGKSTKVARQLREIHQGLVSGKGFLDTSRRSI